MEKNGISLIEIVSPKFLVTNLPPNCHLNLMIKNLSQKNL